MYSFADVRTVSVPATAPDRAGPEWFLFDAQFGGMMRGFHAAVLADYVAAPAIRRSSTPSARTTVLAPSTTG
jgi:hypothetical protein